MGFISCNFAVVFESEGEAQTWDRSSINWMELTLGREYGGNYQLEPTDIGTVGMLVFEYITGVNLVGEHF